MFILPLYVELAAFVLGCLLVRRNWPVPYRFLVALRCLDFGVSILSSFYSLWFHRSNHWIYNLFLPAEAFSFLYIFYKTAVHGKVRRADGGLLVLLAPLIVLSYLLSHSFFFLNTYAGISCSFLSLLAACGAFIDLLADKRELRLFRQPMFWMAGGVLLYSISNIIFYITWEYSKKMVYYNFFSIEYFLGMALLNLGMIGCFICLYQQQPVGGKGLVSHS
jgi:hypothetical protein